MSMIRLNGVSFCDLPHIRNKSRGEDGQLIKGEEVYVVREEGEAWDSDARPAYSVRLESMHIGYIPLMETLMEEKLKARDGFVKVWKSQYQNMTPEELREVATFMNETGNTEGFSEWCAVDADKAKEVYRRKDAECENCIIVRDFFYVEIMRNRMTPQGRATAVYWDEKEGRNLVEIGEVCSVSVLFEIY